MTRFLPLVAVCIAALSTTAFSQGQYLKAGESGIGLGASLGFAEDEFSFGGGPSFSYLGRVDFAANYSHVSVASTPFSPEFNTNNYGGSVTTHILKQTEKIPFGLAADALYLHATIGGGDLEEMGIDGSIDAFGFGGLLHTTLPIGNGFAALIGAGYHYSIATIEMEGSSESEDSHSYPLGVQGIFSLGDKGKLVAGPSFTINKETNVIGVSAAYIFPL